MYGVYFNSFITVRINGVEIDVYPFSDYARYAFHTYTAPRGTVH